MTHPTPGCRLFPPFEALQLGFHQSLAHLCRPSAHEKHKAELERQAIAAETPNQREIRLRRNDGGRPRKFIKDWRAVLKP